MLSQVRSNQIIIIQFCVTFALSKSFIHVQLYDTEKQDFLGLCKLCIWIIVNKACLQMTAGLCGGG